MAKKKNVDDMTLAELHEEASAQGIEGRSSMPKDELVRALKGGAAKGAEGTRPDPYPPPTTDQAGEKTGGPPPSKRLPADAPEDEGADELTQMKAAVAELSKVVNNLGGNAQEIVKGVVARLPAKKVAKAGPARKAVVTAPGGEEVEVEYQGEESDAAALEAYKAKRGIWHLPEQPAVRHGAADKADKTEE